MKKNNIKNPKKLIKANKLINQSYNKQNLEIYMILYKYGKQSKILQMIEVFYIIIKL